MIFITKRCDGCGDEIRGRDETVGDPRVQITELRGETNLPSGWSWADDGKGRQLFCNLCVNSVRDAQKAALASRREAVRLTRAERSPF